MNVLGQDDDHLVGASKQRDRMRPMPVTVSGTSCMSTLWLIATFLLLSGLIVAGGFPNWIHNQVDQSTRVNPLGNALLRVDLGIYYMCYRLRGCGEDNSDVCGSQCREARVCGCYTYLDFDPPERVNSSNSVAISSGMQGLNSLQDIVFLFSASIVYAFGCFLLLLSLLVGSIAYCKPKLGHCSLFAFAFVLQSVAGITLIVSLALIPVFFGSEFVQQFCGSSADYYIRGQCSIDWSLFLGMVVTACTLYLPAFAIFSMNISDGLNAHLCC